MGRRLAITDLAIPAEGDSVSATAPGEQVFVVYVPETGLPQCLAYADEEEAVQAMGAALGAGTWHCFLVFKGQKLQVTDSPLAIYCGPRQICYREPEREPQTPRDMLVIGEPEPIPVVPSPTLSLPGPATTAGPEAVEIVDFEADDEE